MSSLADFLTGTSVEKRCNDRSVSHADCFESCSYPQCFFGYDAVVLEQRVVHCPYFHRFFLRPSDLIPHIRCKSLAH